MGPFPRVGSGISRSWTARHCFQGKAKVALAKMPAKSQDSDCFGSFEAVEAHILWGAPSWHSCGASTTQLKACSQVLPSSSCHLLSVCGNPIMVFDEPLRWPRVDPEWLDCHKAKRPHPPSNGPPTKRPGFWVETFETLGTWSFGVQMPVMKCRSAKQGDSTDFHSFGCGRVPKKHWVVVLDEGTYVLPGSSWWGLPHCPSGKVEVGGARLVSVGRCSTGWDLSRPEKFHCLWGGKLSMGIWRCPKSWVPPNHPISTSLVLKPMVTGGSPISRKANLTCEISCEVWYVTMSRSKLGGRWRVLHRFTWCFSTSGSSFWCLSD